MKIIEWLFSGNVFNILQIQMFQTFAIEFFLLEWIVEGGPCVQYCWKVIIFLTERQMNRYILYISPTVKRSNWRHFYRKPGGETHFRIPLRYFNLTQAAPD